MDRYKDGPPNSELPSNNPNLQYPHQDKAALNRKHLKLHKYIQPNTYTLGTINSIDTHDATDNKIPFKPQNKKVAKQMPAVGQYNIAIPIVKPAYETYQKNNEVVLVKINHIGGTSSFRSEQHRFDQGTQSIYIPSLTPGPGTYHQIVKKKNKEQYHKPYNESYDIIHGMIMQNRQTIESIPNYSLPSKADMKYNGMPRHLQEMYHKLDRARAYANNYRDTSLQLKDLMRIRQQREQVPMRAMEQPASLLSWDIEKKKARTIPHITTINEKLTQTMHRFQLQKKKQTQRAEKIEAILRGEKKRSLSLQRSNLSKYSNQSRMIKDRYNQNMVNILFGQKSRRGHARHTTDKYPL